MTRLKIEGMSCEHCVKAVTEALADVDGVDKVTHVDLDSGEAEVDGTAGAEALIKAVEEEGYEARVA